MSSSIKRILIIDLESTCFEGMSRTDQNNITEIIEIGITEINTLKKQIIQTDSWLIQPEKTMITDYCTKLTGISQEMVKKEGLSLIEVSKIIKEKYNQPLMYYSAWGEDNLLIEKDFKEKKAENPFPTNFINLKDMYCLKFGQHLPDRFLTALSKNNIIHEGKLHRAGDDSLNTAKLFLKIFA